MSSIPTKLSTPELSKTQKSLKLTHQKSKEHQLTPQKSKEHQQTHQESKEQTHQESKEQKHMQTITTDANPEEMTMDEMNVMTDEQIKIHCDKHGEDFESFKKMIIQYKYYKTYKTKLDGEFNKKNPTYIFECFKDEINRLEFGIKGPITITKWLTRLSFSDYRNFIIDEEKKNKNKYLKYKQKYLILKEQYL